MWVELLALVAVLLVALHFYTQSRLLPGVVSYEQTPLLGNWPALLRNIDRFYDWKLSHAEQGAAMGHEAVQRAGPFFGVVEVHSPRMLKHMLQDDFNSFEKGPRFRGVFQEFLGNGIFNSDGDTWRLQRKTASHMFSAAKLNNYMLATFVDHAETLLTVLEQHKKKQDALGAGEGAKEDAGRFIDMQRVFYAYTMDSIMRIGFGVQLDSLLHLESPPAFVAAFDRVQEAILFRFLGPPLKWRLLRFFRWGNERQVAENLLVIDEFVYAIVQARKANPDAYKDSGDLLSLFIAQAARTRSGTGKDAAAESPTKSSSTAAAAEVAAAEQSAPSPSSSSSSSGSAGASTASELSDKELRDIVLNFMLAGRDTTASLLTFLFHELAVHPRVERRVRREVDRVLGRLAPTERSDPHSATRGLTHDALREMVYLEAVILETLRLHPPVPVDNKVCVSASVFPDGLRVPAGKVVSYSPYIFGRMQSIWGEDARIFRPERFLKRVTDAMGERKWALVQPSPYALPAFNAGFRLCLGKSMALMEAKTCAASLVRRYALKEKEGHDPRYRITIVMAMKHGLPVTVHERTDDDTEDEDDEEDDEGGEPAEDDAALQQAAED